MGKKDPNNFETKDLHLNGYLKIKRFQYRSLRAVGNTVYASYELTPELALAVTEYYGKQALIDPTEFSSALRGLRHEFNDFIIAQFKEMKNGGDQNE